MTSSVPVTASSSSIELTNNASLGVNSNTGTGVDLSRQFSSAVQDEANKYFQQIYAQPSSQSMGVNEFVLKLKQFRDGDEHQRVCCRFHWSRLEKKTTVFLQEVFECMLKNLFEEYKYFHQYPTRELDITAEVFGRIINDQVVSGSFSFSNLFVTRL
jgi:CCR4-NOT transcription complex subunit 1